MNDKNCDTMTNTQTPRWLSTSLFYNEPWEEFLAEAVKPLADVTLQAGIASNFFFSRNWDRGPHIRLHFKGDIKILETILKPHIRDHFDQYFSSKPSVRLEPTYPNVFPSENKWLPNNSLTFLPYNDIERAFPRFLEIDKATQLLQVASSIALNYFKTRGALNAREEAQNLATKLQFGLLYASGADLEHVGKFSAWAYKRWLDDQSLNPTDIHNLQAGYKRLLAIHGTELDSYHTALWELIRKHHDLNDLSYTNWIVVCSRLFLSLGESPSSNSGKYRTQVYYLLKCINNLLGVTGKNEGFLFFSVANSMLPMKFTPVKAPTPSASGIEKQHS